MKPVGVQVGSHHEHTRLVYAEDLGIGQRFDLGSHTVTEAELVDFATHWDPQWFHIDRAAAQDGQFGGLIASGIHTLAILQHHDAVHIRYGLTEAALPRAHLPRLFQPRRGLARPHGPTLGRAPAGSDKHHAHARPAAAMSSRTRKTTPIDGAALDWSLSAPLEQMRSGRTVKVLNKIRRHAPELVTVSY